MAQRGGVTEELLGRQAIAVLEQRAAQHRVPRLAPVPDAVDQDEWLAAASAGEARSE